MSAVEAIDYAALSEMELVEYVRQGDLAATRLLITRNNQRLFRAAWSILRSRPDAEEAVQEGYLKAFAALPGFRGESSLSTWLTRIVVNEALGRKRGAKRRAKNLEDCGVASIENYREALMQGSSPGPSAESALMRRHIASLLEVAIAALPKAFRLVFVLREIENLSVAETAQVLGITEQTIKTRLHRAKQRLQIALKPQLDGALADTFVFAGVDCEALTERVMARLIAQRTS